MINNRRRFLKLTGMAGFGLAGIQRFPLYASEKLYKGKLNKIILDSFLTTLEDGQVLSTPFWRIETGMEGPSLVLVAAQHGNEVMGAEVARRFREICAD